MGRDGARVIGGSHPFDPVALCVKQVTGAQAVVLIVAGSADFPTSAEFVVLARPSKEELTQLAATLRSCAEMIEQDARALTP